jgi:hypothetical protein
VITSEFTFQNSHPVSVGHKDAFLLYSNTPGKKFKTKLCFSSNNSDYLQKARKYGHFTGYKN